MVKKRVGEKITSNCDDDHSPQFFKIFQPNHSSKHLRIPPAFLRYFKQGWPSKSIIKCPLRGSWPVDLNKVDDNLYFQSGWEEFVQDNSLEFGDFLVFSYNGHSKFYVSIYGKNRCRKEVRDTGMQCENERVMHSQKNLKNEPGKSEDLVSVEVDDAEEVDTQYPMDLSAIPSKCPAFEITMQPAYVYKGLLSFPRKFGRIVNDRRDYVKLQHSSKAWVVKLVGNFTTRIQLTKGWREFVEENSVCLGDVCTFELVGMEKDMYVMNVSILRAGKKSAGGMVEYF